MPRQVARSPGRGPRGLPGPPRRLGRQVPAHRRRRALPGRAPSTPPGSSTSPDRAEVARLVAESAREAARQTEKVARLGARLVRVPARKIGTPPDPDPALDDEETLLSWPFDPQHPGHPSHLVAGLEATAIGCSWLRDQWDDLGRILREGRTWQPMDRVRAIRLLGKQPLDFVADPQALSIYLACHAMDPNGPDVFAEPLSHVCRPRTEAKHQQMTARYAAVRAERYALGRVGRAGGAGGDHRGGGGAGGGAAGGPGGGGGGRPAGHHGECRTTARWAGSRLRQHQGTCSRSLLSLDRGSSQAAAEFRRRPA